MMVPMADEEKGLPGLAGRKSWAIAAWFPVVVGDAGVCSPDGWFWWLVEVSGWLADGLDLTVRLYGFGSVSEHGQHCICAWFLCPKLP